MLPPPLIPDNSNGKELKLDVSVCRTSKIFKVLFLSRITTIQFLLCNSQGHGPSIFPFSISEISCSCFKQTCSCLLPKDGNQNSNNFYSDSINQSQYLPSSNENYWIPNRLNQSTTFNYSTADVLLNNHNEPEFINFEPNSNADAYKLSPLSGEVFQPDEIFQLDQPIRYPNSTFNSSSPQTLLDLGSGTIETKINTTTHCFNDASESFYTLNEDSTSSSQNNETSICGYSSYHTGNNNSLVGNNNSIDTQTSNFSGCDGIGHMIEIPRYENSLHIQYDHQTVNYKANRGKYEEMVVDSGYRKSFEFYDENQTYMHNGSEQVVAMMNEKLNQQANGSDMSLTYHQQQFMEPCFNYASNDIDSTYKIALDSGQ